MFRLSASGKIRVHKTLKVLARGFRWGQSEGRSRVRKASRRPADGRNLLKVVKSICCLQWGYGACFSTHAYQSAITGVQDRLFDNFNKSSASPRRVEALLRNGWKLTKPAFIIAIQNDGDAAVFVRQRRQRDRSRAWAPAPLDGFRLCQEADAARCQRTRSRAARWAAVYNQHNDQ